MRRTYLGALLALALALAVVALLVALAGPADAAPTYINGDWTIANGDTITRANEEIILTSGNLIVKTGGELTLRSVTLRLNSTASTRYHIEVENGGTLYIYDGDSDPSTTSDASLITANNTAYNYAWWVQDGGALYINDSRVEECGVANPADDRGLNIESSSCVIDSVDFKACYYGLTAYYASPTVRDCTFTDSSSVGAYLYSSSTNVLRCDFTNCPYGVLAYYSSPKVTDSTFTSSSTYGIYVYDATAEVDGCTLTDMAYIGVIASYNSVTITDTTVDGPGSYGIYAQYTTLTCARNTVDDINHGFYLYRNYVGSSVTDCTATNCSSNGVYVYLSPITLTDVRAYDFSTNGIQLYSASGAMTDLWAEGGPTGLYLRSSTSTVTGLTVKGATTAGISSSGGSPTVRSFSVTGSATGLSAFTSTAFSGYDGTISGSSTRDVDVSGTSTATLTNVSFSMASSRVQDAGSTLRRQWWVDVLGVWQDGTPVASGTYTVRDSASTVVASGTLGTDGRVLDLQVRQSQMTSTGTTTYTPHSFFVAKGGLTGSTTATIDTNRQVTVTVTDDVAPSGYVLQSEPMYTKGTWNQLRWTAGTDVGVGGMEYWCEMSDVGTFAYAIGNSGWTTSLSQIFSGLADGVTYYYRVRARDGVGNLGAWSNVESSTQDSAPPSVPVVVEEPDYTQGTSNTITWGTSTDSGIGSVQYRVQYTNDPTFNTVLATSAWQAGTSLAYAGLTDGTRYYYRVQSRDGFSQESQWSSPVRSTQDASPPPAPVIAAEPTYTKTLSNTLAWNPVVDAGVGGVEYYIEWDDQWWFPSPGGNSGWTTATSHTFSGLPEATWVYYQMRARDALGQASVNSGLVWSLQDNSAPSVPVMSAEPQYTQGTSNTIAWAASSDGSGAWGITYWAEVDADAAFGSPDFTSGWTSSTGHTFSSLSDGVTYYYRVKAKDGVDWESSWSSTVSSTQDASPPPAPTMATEPDYTRGTSNAVSWTAVTDASGGTVGYEAQASTSSVFATIDKTSGWIAATTYTFTVLTDGTTYYYRVRSRDQFAQAGSWSNIVSSTQDATAPTGPTMVTEPTYTKGSTNTVEWTTSTDAGSGGVQYYCEYDDDWQFGSPNGVSGWVSTTSYTFTGIAENVWYYVHVRARDAVGNAGGFSTYTWSRQDATPPSTPTLTALPAFSAGTQVTTTWTASSDGSGIWQITYRVQYATSAAFTTILGESMWQSATSFPFSGLTSGATYHFRVKAKDGLDQESGWSSSISTTMDSTPPTTPFLASEPMFTQGTSNTLTWSASTDVGAGGVQYECQASTSPTFGTIAATSGWVTATSQTFTGLTSGTTYYYRVHARDSLRQESAWSNVERSTQDATAPPAPTITTEPTYTEGTTNTVYWGAVTDATSGGVEYWCEYDDAWQFTSPNGNSGWVTTTQATFTGISEDVWYYYHVRARDAVGNVGSWSGITWSRQDATAPTAPTMSAEPAYTAGTSNTVAWGASSDGSGVGGITYQAELATSNTFAVVLSTSPWLTSRSFTFLGLSDGTTYYYRVRARDALDHVSSYSNVVSSTQDASAPPAPFLAAEPAYTAGTSNTVSWSAVADGGAGGVQYQAQRSTSPAFTSVVQSSWQTGTSYTFTGLTSGTTYYFRVHARDSFGLEGPWSNIERSTQDATAPTTPTLATPPLYSEGSSLALKWSVSTDAGVGGVEYYIEYDNDFAFRSPNGNSGWITSTTYTFSGLAEGTLWFYRVRARDALGYTSGNSGIVWSIQDASSPTTPRMNGEPAYTEGVSNSVSWSTSTDSGVGGVQYHVLCDNDANMATPVYSSGWITTTSYTFFGLADGVMYYYAVQARDAFDHRTALSLAVSSTQDASAPTTPAMEVEPEHTQGTANTLAWSAASDAGIGGVRYRLEWATAPSFATLAGALDWFDGTSATVSGLADGTKYYWRVRARDALNHLTPWSNVVQSTQDASAPPAPTMTAEPLYSPGTTNTLYWSSVKDAGVGGVQYNCELSTDASFTSPLGSGWTDGTEWTWSFLSDGSRYWYRVRSRDAFDQRSAWSNSVSSTQDDRAPSVPSLTAEPAFTQGTTNELVWSTATDAGVGGVEYETQCSIDPGFATISLSSPWSSATRYTFSGLSDGVAYSYRVRSRDAFDHRSAWSASQRSTQDASPPTTPSLAAEPPYTQGTSNTVQWSASTDAGVGGVQYFLQCGRDGAFQSIFGQSGWITATTYTFTGLGDGATYYYRVRSRDAFGQAGAWSVVERSTQDASPPSMPRLDPEPAYTEGSSNRLSWSLSFDTGVGGVLYLVELSFNSNFQPPQGSSGLVPSREWTFTGLPERAIYYRVRAIDALGQMSPWSPTVVSTQDASPPSTPQLNDLEPYSRGRAVALAWSPAVDLGIANVEYWVEWDDDPMFVSPGGSSGWVASVTHTFDGLPEHIALSFRVRARDAFDHRTPWSGARATTCDATAPPVPYPASEPLYTQGTTNRIEWSTSVDQGVGGVEYEAQATSDPTWTTIDLQSGWLKANGYTFPGLADARTYYYRVRARDSFQWTSAWSPVVSSMQDASAPPIPMLRPEPTFTEGLSNMLEWAEVLDAGVGGVEYEVQWSTVPTFTTIGGDSGYLRDTRHTFAGLPEGIVVHYRLRARDAFGQESPWSAEESSMQDASPPQVPIVRAEPDHTAGTSNTVEWLASLDAGVGGLQYEAQSSTGASFTDIVTDTGWLSQTRYTFRSLADGVEYHYRVRARDAFGHESAWSTAVASTQDASPPEVAFLDLPEVVSTTTLRVDGTAVDAGAGVASVELSSDGGATWRNATFGSDAWTFVWSGYSSGAYRLLARATDVLGAVSVPVGTWVDVDLDAPEAAITSPSTNATLTGLVAVRGTATDPHMARFDLMWTRNGINFTAIAEDQPFTVTGGTLAIWDTRGLDDGDYELVLEVNDTTGRTSVANVSVHLVNSDMEIGPGDLMLSDPYPYEGDNLTISATFRNTGTSRARDVRVVITDNGQPLYESYHTIAAGDSLTVAVPYVVPDHGQLHTIRVEASYRDNPGDRGTVASVGITGKKVVEEPFFSSSELATLLIAIVVAILGSLLGAWLLDRRRGTYAMVAAPVPAASAGMTLSGMQKVGMDSVQWDDDRF